MNYESILNFITGQTEDVSENVRPGTNLTAIESLEIYRTDYYSRLQNVVSSHFPITHKLLGDEQFYKYARMFVAQNPSKNWDINFYGEAWPSFLQKERGPSIDRFFPFLVELAQLEWNSHLLFHAPTEANPINVLEIDENFLAALQISPLLKLYSSNYRLPDIYRAIQNETQFTSIPTGQPAYFFLSRRNFHVHIEELNENEFYLLNIWQQSGTLSKASEAISDNLNDTHPILSEITPLLQRLAEINLLTSRSVKKSGWYRNE